MNLPARRLTDDQQSRRRRGADYGAWTMRKVWSANLTGANLAQQPVERHSLGDRRRTRRRDGSRSLAG
jgi:hypothetical protein